MLTYIKQLFTLVKMVELSPLTDERKRRNEEKREGKIRPPDSILGPPLLHFGVALTPSRGGHYGHTVNIDFSSKAQTVFRIFTYNYLFKQSSQISNILICFLKAINT